MLGTIGAHREAIRAPMHGSLALSEVTAVLRLELNLGIVLPVEQGGVSIA